jgi:HEAT repeat protein
MGKDGAHVLAIQLKLGDARVRLSAAEALGQMGEVAERHTTNLAARLADSDPFSRMAAAEALGRMRELAHPYCGALAGRLQDVDPYVRMTAADALSRLGDNGARALASHLSSADPMVRRSIVRSLGKMAEDAHPHVPELATKLSDGDMRVQLAAWDALVQLEDATNPSAAGATWSHETGELAVPRFLDTTPQSSRSSTKMRGSAPKDPLAQYAAAARLTGRAQKPGASELELLGLDDIKISSPKAAMEKRHTKHTGRLNKTLLEAGRLR